MTSLLTAVSSTRVQETKCGRTQERSSRTPLSNLDRVRYPTWKPVSPYAAAAAAIYMHLCDCFFILILQSHTIHSNTTFQFQKEADMEALTLTGLMKQKAAEFPSGRALSASGKFDLTHSRLDELVDKAASLLIASGINPGDVVALTFPNTVEVSFSR